jgi:thermolysin
MKRIVVAAAAVAALVSWFDGRAAAQRRATLAIRASTPEQLRAWDDYVTARERAGLFRVRRTDVDPSMPSRVVERLEQYHGGVRVWGAEVVRDLNRGAPQAFFGEIAADLDVAVTPAIGAAAARQQLLALAAGATLLGNVELVVVPLVSGEHRLTYTGVVSAGLDIFRAFIDAGSGAELLRYSAIQTQSAVGTGQGLFGARKKMSVMAEAGTNFADDRLRPPVLRTFDMQGNVFRALAVLTGAALAPAERAQDADNDWTDVAAVDAHAHIGWTYDYLFKRHGRRGLDNQDRPITTLINGVRAADAFSVPPEFFGTFVLNAFWCGACGQGGIGMMYFGNGVPSNVINAVTGQTFAPFSGALDVAAHELAHGVIDSSSGLIYANESGALNESFADIIGTSAEFFFQPPGGDRGQAEYLIAEDSVRAVRPGSVNGLRSMENPSMFGDPDHYSRRFTGPEDDGGVHINSGIPNHAFYLAVEGGTNRTSRTAVQGVGGANREQIEKVFYRAFVFLLPPNATFATARAATIQAARDLYGSGSAPERAVTQAWTAVGVS